MKVKFSLNVDLVERSYDIAVEAGLLRTVSTRIAHFLDGNKCLIVSDSNVYTLYGKKIVDIVQQSATSVASSIIAPGEASKTLTSMATLYHDSVKANLDRNSYIIALGGGVPGDMAGFLAATYMRGIRFIQIPTSLLAMVDSSVGGKTGIDLPEGKNLVGAFWQPDFVAIDPEMLTTLPEREMRCGLAEVVKYAMIIDSDFFELLDNNTKKLINCDLDFYSKVIAHCCRLKAQIVEKDERESGIRAILNYGHTFGHALEAVAGFNTIQHGEGVAIGMCMAADLAVDIGMLDVESATAQEQLLEKLALPSRVSGLDPKAILEAMSKDKKTEKGKLKFILPQATGKVSIESNISNSKVLRAIEGRCS